MRRPATSQAHRGGPQSVLRQVGLPVSRQRRLVLDALRGRDRPVTAQDLHWELKLRSREWSAADSAPGLTTVYRILAVLAQRNVVHCFAGDGQTAYRLCAPDRHDHLVCQCCGRVQEYPGGRIAPAGGFMVAGQTPARRPGGRQCEMGTCRRRFRR